VSGLSEEIGVNEYLRVNEMGTTLKVPGRHVVQDVTFSRGLIADDCARKLEQWYLETRDIATGDRNPSNNRRGIVITWQDGQGGLVKRATLVKAWPSRLEFGGLDATSSGVVLQAVTFVSEEVNWK